MYNRSFNTTRTLLRIIGGVVYAVGFGLIIFSFASFFLAPVLSIAFTGVFSFVILGIIASSFGRMLIGLSRTKNFSGPVSEQRPVKREEVQEEMTYDYTFVSDREAKAERKSSTSYSRCPECDAENEDKASTCKNCGATLYGYKKCTMCYKLNDKDRRFCKNCGHDFNLD